jgi:hypothetical protein
MSQWITKGYERPAIQSRQNQVGRAPAEYVLPGQTPTRTPLGQSVSQGWLDNFLETRNRRVEETRRRLDFLSQVAKSRRLYPSEEIELQALQERYKNLISTDQPRTTAGSKLISTTAGSARDTERKSQRQAEEDRRFLDSYSIRRSQIMSGPAMNREADLARLESEYQSRLARQLGRDLSISERRQGVEEADVATKTARGAAEQIARKREADIARKEQLAGLTEEQRAAAEEISQMMMGITDDTVIAQMNKLIGQLSKNVSPEAIIRQAEGLAEEARRKEQIRKEAVQQAQANRIEIQDLRAQARKDYESFKKAANQQAFAAQAKADIVKLINRERVRIANMNGILDALNGIKNPDERQKDAISDYNAALSGAKQVLETYAKILREGGAAAGVEGVEGAVESVPSQRQPNDGTIILPSKPNPADLIPGQLYSYKGRKARWTGYGWDFMGA